MPTTIDSGWGLKAAAATAAAHQAGAENTHQCLWPVAHKGAMWPASGPAALDP